MPLNISGSILSPNEVREYEYNSIIRNGLVLHLDARIFNTVSGTTWFDLSGNGSHGTLTNGPLFNSENQGNIVFDGSNDVVAIPNNTSLDTQTPTVEVWVKTNSLNQNGFWFEKGTVNEQYSLFQEGTTIVWRLNVGGSTNYAFNSLSTTTATYINTSQWFQIVGTYTSGARRLYVNGVLVNSDTRTGTIATNSGGMSIGAYGGFAGARGYYYNGGVAIVRVYNRALTATEILHNFNVTRVRFSLPPPPTPTPTPTSTPTPTPTPTPVSDYQISAFLVGGGGGGGSFDNIAGVYPGGGGGGYTQTSNSIGVSRNIQYTVTVGGGGAAGISNGNGGRGNSSVFNNITAEGGYGGITNGPGGNGGSGGGFHFNNGGSDGGNGGGSDGTNSMGQGTTTREFGDSNATLYSGGGGGGRWTVATYGGDGGGGNGKSENYGVVGTMNGTANLGGGGGGNATFPRGGGVAAGSGGSGIVIIRTLDSIAQASTTGSPTITTSGGYRFYRFTSSGTITFL